MMDHAIIQAVEDSSYRAGYPRDAGAVLLIELDGLDAGLSIREDQIRQLAATTAALRFEWRATRKSAPPCGPDAKEPSAPAAASVPTCT